MFSRYLIIALALTFQTSCRFHKPIVTVPQKSNPNRPGPYKKRIEIDAITKEVKTSRYCYYLSARKGFSIGACKVIEISSLDGKRIQKPIRKETHAGMIHGRNRYYSKAILYDSLGNIHSKTYKITQNLGLGGNRIVYSKVNVKNK